MTKKFGFLRETKELAKKAGIDKTTGLPRTGLDEYLSVIFSNTTDWVHDKIIPNSQKRYRPDYRSDSLMLIVEFDGLPHYQNPKVILSDKEKDKYYKELGYNVVRIPYFIQLTKKVVKEIFGVDVKRELFPEGVSSLNIENCNTPAFLCKSGVERMKQEFKKIPEQYKTNIDFLESQNNEFLTGVSLIKDIDIL